MFVSRETLNMEIVENCPVCNSKKFNEYLSVRDNLVTQKLFNLKKCEDCGFIFTSPRPDSNSISKYYISEDYISHSETKKSIFNSFYNLLRSRNISYKLALISKYKNANLNIYDYGCGVGSFLNVASKNGWNVLGFEPNIKAKDIAVQSGVDIKTPDELLNDGKKSIDVITLWHVLEHIHELDKTISKLYALLADDGVMVVAVPIINSWDATKYKEDWAALDVPRHLYHFTQNTIEKLFTKHGMSIASVHPLKFDSYYICLLSEKIPILKYFTAIVNGWYSNYKARRTSNYSSLIFVIQKNRK